MSWKKRLLGEEEVSRDLILLLVIGALYATGIALSNSFVNVYIWKQSRSYFNLGFYNLAVVVFQPLTFIIAGRLVKRWDRIYVLRLGVFSLALFYVIVLIIKNHASSYSVLLGAVLGVGYGFYWLAYNVLTFEITEPETRDFFNGFQGALSSLAGIASPLLSGFLITRMKGDNGYLAIFTLSLLTFVVCIVLSFFISRRELGGRYELGRIFKERLHNKNWASVLHAHISQGLREGSFIFVISIMVYETTKNELALGTFGMISSAVSFLCYYLASRIIRGKRRLPYIFWGGVILYASVLLLFFKITYLNLLLYAAVIAIGYPIVLVPYTGLTFDVIGTSFKPREYRVEYVIVREVYLNIGRMLSIVTFLLLMKFVPSPWNVKLLLILLGSGYFLIYFSIKNVKIIRNTEVKKN